MNDTASEIGVASSFGPDASGPSFVIRLPDLNAISQPGLKLFRSADDVAVAVAEKPLAPKSIMRIDAAVQTTVKPDVADLTVAAVTPEAPSQWRITAQQRAIAAVAVSKTIARSVGGKLQNINWAALAAVITAVAIKILPSRGQFLAITGILLLGAALMTRGHITRPGARTTRLDPSVVSTTLPTDASRQLPGQAVAIPNAATAAQYDRNLATQGGMTLPSLQPPVGSGALPAPGPRSQIDQSSPDQKSAWPSSPAQSYEAKRPPESDTLGGRLSDSPIPPVTDPRDRAPYLPPNPPVLAAAPTSGSAPSAAGMSPRVASRDVNNRNVAPPSGALPPPAARLDGNIAYPPIRGSYDRAGSSVY